MNGRRAVRSLIVMAAALFAITAPARAGPQPPASSAAATAAYQRGDLTTARDAWEQACQAGSPADCYHLGIVYRDGEGVAADPGRYAALMVTACDGEVASACYHLGRDQLRAVEEGTGPVSADQLQNGIAFYRRACTLGLDQACGNLSLHLAREAAKGDGAALAALRQTCIDGQGAACFGIASLYDIHLDATLGDDRDAANSALLLGCERMNRDSCQNLAWHYDHGFGFDRNQVRGAALYHLACDDDPGFNCPFIPGSAIAARPDRAAPVMPQWQRAAGAYRAGCEDQLAMGCFGYARLIAKSGRGTSDGAEMRRWLERALTITPGLPIATELLRRMDAGELPAAPRE